MLTQKRYVMKKTLFVILSLLLSSALFADDYKAEVNHFFSLYGAGKRIEAVDYIYSTNPWMSSATDAIENVKTQLQGIDKLVGRYNGYELIDTLNVKDRFVHLTYLVLYDRQPLRMEFAFYKPKEKWMIYSFSFDVGFPDDVQAEARNRTGTK